MHFEIDKNFVSEILRQLDMELKLYHIWHLTFGARSLNDQNYLIFRNQNMPVAFVQNIRNMLVSLII